MLYMHTAQGNAMDMNSGSHMVYRLYTHIIFVTKYREKKFEDRTLNTLESILRLLCEKRGSKIVEFNGESDHVHFLLDYHPDTSVSQLICILKSGSSRQLKLHHPELNQFAWRKNALWSTGYFVCSVGGVPIEVLKKYIEQQDRPH
ncbi:IS200/IS605 family transposase [Litorivivens sp.]|uniref:IS200/IS605 family transposase n=1 Tax=Litorivivens sp. TaxID=2020868 RepID=UPI003561BA78